MPRRNKNKRPSRQTLRTGPAKLAPRAPARVTKTVEFTVSMREKPVIVEKRWQPYHNETIYEADISQYIPEKAIESITVSQPRAFLWLNTKSFGKFATNFIDQKFSAYEFIQRHWFLNTLNRDNVIASNEIERLTIYVVLKISDPPPPDCKVSIMYYAT